jgi:MFS family permease
VALIRGATDERSAVPSGRAILSQMAAGFAEVHRSPMVRLMLVFIAGAGLLRGIADVAFTVVADDRLDGGGGAAGYLAVVYGIGGLAAVASSTRLATATRVTRPFLAAGVASGVSLVATAIAASYATATVGFALMGLGDAMLVLTATVLIQRIAPTEVLARIFGIVEGIQMGGLALGSYLVSVLVSSLSLGPALGVTSAIVSVLVLGAVAVLHRNGHDLPAVDEETVARLIADPVFAALPAPVIERLARDAERIAAPAGTVIVREGDAGDRYYLVVAGDVAFTIDGRPIRVLGADHSFGEIALLRDVPRTATATAASDVELIAVSRDEFLASVTGHPRSFVTASDVADTWLRSP